MTKTVKCDLDDKPSEAKRMGKPIWHRRQIPTVNKEIKPDRTGKNEKWIANASKGYRVARHDANSG